MSSSPHSIAEKGEMQMKWKNVVMSLLIELASYIAAVSYLMTRHELTRTDMLIIAALVLISHHAGKYLGQKEQRRLV